MSRTRILVADPLNIVRAGVRTLLVRESDFDVVEAANLADVGEAIATQCPDIALVDLELPPSGGIGAVARLRDACCTRTIVWSFEPTADGVLAAVRAGACGYLHKEISPEGLVRALRLTLRGQAPLARDLAALMIDALQGLDVRARTLAKASALSARERQVLDLVAQGAANRQIAADLEISEFTVKRHVQNILHKLSLPSRRAAGALYRAAVEAELSPAGWGS